MKIQTLFQTLEKSSAYKDFRKDKETKDAFFCAGFFILQFKQNTAEYSLDFRNDKELFAFKIPEKEGEDIVMTRDKLIEEPKPMNKIEEKDVKNPKNLKVDIEDIRAIVEREMQGNKIVGNLDEAIAVLQDSDSYKKLIWHLTCIVSGFTILSVILDPKTGDVLKFEKKNLLDFASVKKVDKK